MTQFELYISIVLLFVFFILGLLLGLFLGKKQPTLINKEYYRDQESNISTSTPRNRDILTDHQREKIKSIQIDDRVYVTKNDCSNITRFYDKIAETKGVNDNVQQDIDKLKKLKGE